MDKQTTLGFVLIALVLMVWMWWSTPKPSNQPQEKNQPTVVQKDSAVPPQATQRQEKKEAASVPQVQQPPTSDSLGKFFSGDANGKEQIVTIETDLYTAEVSTKGGAIEKFVLKNYRTWDQYPVQLVENATGGDFSILFTSTDGKLIDTRGLFFTANLPPTGNVRLTGDEEYSIAFTLNAGTGKIVKTLRFKNNSYGLDVGVKLVGMQDIIANYEYQVVWENGIRYVEGNSVDESRQAEAYLYAGGEVSSIDASKPGQTPVSNTSGETEWVATRNKYFAVVLLSDDKKADGAYLEGRCDTVANHGMVEHYSIALKVPFKNTVEESAKFTLFIGPLEYDIINSYGRGLVHIMSLGWSWIRPISVYLLIPLFKFLHLFISNYGLVIIVFSILIKIALHPLTRSSMKSMKKMQALQPLMEEIRTKFKDDPNQMNVQIMKLYKDYGVNPAGGCLPLLIQMPILYALYALFANSIQLRQAGFVWWIKDLSIPDIITELPFTLPFFGVHNLSGLALMMGITMFIQQKMTVNDPRQKAMVWMMPVMMTLLFNSLPSGLNLYYFVFNLLAIAQQMYINKQHDNTPLQKVSEKKRSGGLMNALTKNLPQPPKR
ncbi:MAG TPA: membrane protein insertase YidC [Bacteroidota bacterium]|nr:membrane protein insertase YidC [Bacteroidota bacterium]